MKDINKKKKLIITLVIAVLVLGAITVKIVTNNNSEKTTVETKKVTKEKKVVKKEEKQVPKDTSIKLSFAGDCTFGNYFGQGDSGTFNQEYLNQNKNAGYFLQNVKEVFGNDDMSIVNLEGPLTTYDQHVTKTFSMCGLPEYANILKQGNVETVTVANNHSEDRLQQGLIDTKSALDQYGIAHFGYEESYVKDVKGIKIGFLGYRSIDTMNTDVGKQTIKTAIDKLKNENKCDTVVIFFHWGIEREYYANNDQRELAKACIDYGADLIIGSHPHVLQGLETYKGKKIAYSLGNFSFGGNKNPGDKDTMIYQVNLNYKDGKLDNTTDEIIPCKLSSVNYRNNYQPMLLEGTEKQRVIDKVNKYSFN